MQEIRVIAVYDSDEGGTFIMVLPESLVGEYSMDYKLVESWSLAGQRYVLYEA